MVGGQAVEGQRLAGSGKLVRRWREAAAVARTSPGDVPTASAGAAARRTRHPLHDRKLNVPRGSHHWPRSQFGLSERTSDPLVASTRLARPRCAASASGIRARLDGAGAGGGAKKEPRVASCPWREDNRPCDRTKVGVVKEADQVSGAAAKPPRN